MKKTLIALTLASLSAAAVADVTIYGNIRAGFYNHSNKAAGDGNSRHSINTIDDFGSYIGFKGSEDVAGGMKAIWQVETGLFGDKADFSGSGWASRETFIGLEGGFGKIRAGYLKSQFGTMGAIDQWEYNGTSADGEAQANGLSIFTRNDVRLANAARYDSPNWGGFSFNLTHGLDEYKRLNHSGAREGNLSTTVLGLNYENAGWFAQYGFGYYNDAYKKASDNKLKAGQAHRLELGYNANNLFVDLGYQYTKGFPSDRNNTGMAAGATDGDGVKSHELALSAAYTFGALTPKITYAHGFKQKGIDGGDKIDNSKYDQVILGLDYAMSKRTTALFSVGYLNSGTNRDNANPAPVANNSNSKDKAYSVGVGLRHLF